MPTPTSPWPPGAWQPGEPPAAPVPPRPPQPRVLWRELCPEATSASISHGALPSPTASRPGPARLGDSPTAGPLLQGVLCGESPLYQEVGRQGVRGLTRTQETDDCVVGCGQPFSALTRQLFTLAVLS